MANTSPLAGLNTRENVEEKILALMAEAYPTLDCGLGTPIYEMVVRPNAYIWARQHEGLDELIKSVSFNDYMNMPEEDLDRLVSRLFVERRRGKYVHGIVRCDVPGTEDFVVNAGEVWEASNGRTYTVDFTHKIKEEDWDDMAPNGDPLHWGTSLENVISGLGHVNTYIDLQNIVNPKEGDTYIVDDEKYAYTWTFIRSDPTGTEILDWVKNSDIYAPILFREVPAKDRHYYEDISVTSTGIGEEFNAAQNDSIKPISLTSIILLNSYFISATNDGGKSETNFELYNRAKKEVSLRGFCSYNSTAGILMDNFDTIDEVVSIGIKDPEMTRDLAQVEVINKYNEKEKAVIHRGGCCDLYINTNKYFQEDGYKAPLGFPIACNGFSLVDAPESVMDNWVEYEKKLIPANYWSRGSLREDLGKGINEKSNIINLKADITDISDFVENSKNTSLHTDNLVKQMYPIVVRAVINIETDSSDPSEEIALAKIAVAQYINSLRSSEAPQVAEVAHIIREIGIKSVRLPMEMRAYYLTPGCSMEYIGLNKETKSAEGKDTLLQPIENDSLKFTINSNIDPEIRKEYGTTQISLRTCKWYTTTELIIIKVVK